MGFFCSQSEQFQYLDEDDMSKFIEQIGLYIKECTVIPYGDLEIRGSPETATVHVDLSELSARKNPRSISRRMETPRHCLGGAAVQPVRFPWNEKKVAGEIYVDEKLADRLERPES